MNNYTSGKEFIWVVVKGHQCLLQNFRCDLEEGGGREWSAQSLVHRVRFSVVGIVCLLFRRDQLGCVFGKFNCKQGIFYVCEISNIIPK